MKEEFQFDHDYLDISKYDGAKLYRHDKSRENRGRVSVELYEYKDLIIQVIARSMLGLSWKFTYSIHHRQSIALLTKSEKEVREFLDAYNIYSNPYHF